MQISSRFDVKIIRKKNNKKMYMRYKDGAVIVTAPSFVSDERISRFIAENEKWIEEQYVKEEQTALKKGQTLYLFGEPFVLAEGKEVCIKDGILYFNGSAQQWKSFIRHYSAGRLRERFEQLRIALGYPPVTLRFGFYSSRWGSCTPARQHISLSLNLAFVPKECVDAIIVHELCHLKHPNHSKAFYEEVRRCMPDYDSRIERLKEAYIPKF